MRHTLSALAFRPCARRWSGQQRRGGSRHIPANLAEDYVSFLERASHRGLSGGGEWNNRPCFYPWSVDYGLRFLCRPARQRRSVHFHQIHRGYRFPTFHRAVLRKLKTHSKLEKVSRLVLPRLHHSLARTRGVCFPRNPDEPSIVYKVSKLFRKYRESTYKHQN